MKVFEFLGSCRNEDHLDAMREFVENTAPSGSGFDSGIELEKAGGDKVVFSTAFHHMNDVGYYIGWTEHKVKVIPSLYNQYNLKISGHNKNDIKEYISDVFTNYLDTDIEEIPAYSNKFFNYNTCEWQERATSTN